MSLSKAALLALALLGCTRGGTGPVPAAAGTGSPAQVSAAPSGAAPAPSGAAPAASVGPSSRSTRYSLRIEGDGEPLELRDGAPRPPLPLLNLEPAVVTDAYGETISACAERTNVAHLCLWLKGEHAVYYDRSGELLRFKVAQSKLERTGNVVDGTVTLVGAAGNDAQQRTLTVRVHVGEDVRSVDALNVWQKAGPWAEL